MNDTFNFDNSKIDDDDIPELSKNMISYTTSSKPS